MMISMRILRIVSLWTDAREDSDIFYFILELYITGAALLSFRYITTRRGVLRWKQFGGQAHKAFEIEQYSTSLLSDNIENRILP